MPPEAYEKTIDRIVDALKREKGILSVYRLGNVNHPGISDIDIIAVFENGAQSSLNIREHLNETGKYLLTHNLAGASRDHFQQLFDYTFWDNLTCIWGEALIPELHYNARNNPHQEACKRQTALEFLTKNYLEVGIQRKYGIFKLRTLLQEAKGVRYDLEFLSIQSQPINNYIRQIITWLDGWFDETPDADRLSAWVNGYYQALEETINAQAAKGHVLWLPQKVSLDYGRNTMLYQSERFEQSFSGISLPASIIAMHKKIYNANLRLNRFRFGINFTDEDPEGILRKRFNLLKEYQAYNSRHIPYFEPSFSSLANQLVKRG
tara:strand:- start:1874 stop:2836 length:963 start_codon:yes stop_codon:yes gene_type:complete